MAMDPYAGIETEEGRQAVYRELLDKYERDAAEHRNAVREMYMPDWKHHRHVQMDIDSQRHKSVLSLAAGSFGVSFAFISQIVDIAAAVYMPVLISAWALFVGAIVFSLLELLVGSKVQDMLLDNVEENIRRGCEGMPPAEPKRWLAMWPDRVLALASTASFIAGVVCLLCFVLLNTM